MCHSEVFSSGFLCWGPSSWVDCWPASHTQAGSYRSCLRESQSQLQLIADHIPRADHLHRRGVALPLRVNRLYADWYRIDRESVIGKEIKDLVPDVAYTTGTASLSESLERETVTFENVTYKDGKSAWCG
jgi:hypothetical protein